MNAPGNPAVMNEISRRLRQKGRLTFAEVMEIALYVPCEGYYAGQIRPRDYRTAPETHPVFGALLAVQLEQIWRLLGAEERFEVVEFGAGDGRLCKDVLAFAKHLPGFARALRYVVVEPVVHTIAQQQVVCAQGEDTSRVRGSALAMPVGNVVGCVVSNELVDAFPVHRVVARDRILYECFVVERDGKLSEVFDPPSTHELAEYFDRLHIRPPEDCLIEVNLNGAMYIQEAARALRKGFLLTIDYGQAAEELYSAQHRAGTVRSFRKHRLSGDVYGELGNRDITADVDFSTLVLTGGQVGLHFDGLATQQHFLRNLGFEAFLRYVDEAKISAGRRFANKAAMQELVSGAGLGKFRVLVQHKGVSDPELDGFNPCNERKRQLLTGRPRLPVPLLDELNRPE